jgi:hypothetical protein
MLALRPQRQTPRVSRSGIALLGAMNSGLEVRRHEPGDAARAVRPGRRRTIVFRVPIPEERGSACASRFRGNVSQVQHLHEPWGREPQQSGQLPQNCAVNAKKSLGGALDLETVMPSAVARLSGNVPPAVGGARETVHHQIQGDSILPTQQTPHEGWL